MQFILPSLWRFLELRGIESQTGLQRERGSEERREGRKAGRREGGRERERKVRTPQITSLVFRSVGKLSVFCPAALDETERRHSLPAGDVINCRLCQRLPRTGGQSSGYAARNETQKPTRVGLRLPGHRTLATLLAQSCS